MRKQMKKWLTLVSAAALVLVGSVAPAHADSNFSLTLSQSSMLIAGQTIQVTTNNLPTDKGVYIEQCVIGQRGPDLSQCTTPRNNPTSVLWVTTLSADLGQGGSSASVAHNFVTVANIGSYNCVTGTCAIVSARDHHDMTDRSLDTLTALSFSKLAPTISKTSALVDAGDTTVVNLAGLASDTGVYVYECNAPVASARPTECVGMDKTVWAFNSSGNLPAAMILGSTDANNALTIKVAGSFSGSKGLIDCQLVACGIFIRRDHLDSGDHSLDTYIPISFAAIVKQNQSVKSRTLAPKAAKAKVGSSTALATKGTKTEQGGLLVWQTSNSRVCATKVVGKSQVVTFKSAGNCTVTATSPKTARLNLATFTWQFTVKK